MCAIDTICSDLSRVLQISEQARRLFYKLDELGCYATGHVMDTSAVERTVAERDVAQLPLHLWVAREAEGPLRPVGGVPTVVGRVLHGLLGEPVGVGVGVWVWLLAVPSLTRPPAERLREPARVVLA